MEILKVIAWPLSFVIIAIFFVIFFRSQIKNLLSRIKTIGKAGIEVQSSPEIQREDKRKEAAQELLVAIGNSIVIQEVETWIRSDLQKRGLDSDGDTVKVLIKQLSATKILLEFEQIHSLIFGSQIFLLKRLNEVAGQGKPWEFVSTHFEHVKNLFPDAFHDWTVEQYTTFLTSRLLITVQNGTYHITNLGVEYLTWITRNGRREDNPL